MFLSLETDMELYLESTEESPQELPIKENWHNDIKDTSNSKLTRSRIMRSDNVVSINLATELSNVENSASTVSEVVKEGSESVEVIKKETCSFKMEKPKILKFSGDVREYAIFRSDFKHSIDAKYNKRDISSHNTSCTPMWAHRSSSNSSKDKKKVLDPPQSCQDSEVSMHVLP